MGNSLTHPLTAFAAAPTPVANLFDTRHVAGTPLTNALITVTPLQSPTNAGGALYVVNPQTFNTTTNGTVTNNLIPMYYRIEIRSRIPAFSTVVTNYVPATNVMINAFDYVVAPTNISPGVFAYSMAQSDARYALASSINGFMSLDDVNTVEYTTWQISDGVMDLWHANATDGLDGSTNPDLISRIGAAETLAAKTLTAPTINGGTQAAPTINNPTLNTPAVSGGTLNSPSITTPTFPTGIIGATNNNPTFRVGVNGLPAGDPDTATTLLWKSTGGTNASGTSQPVVEITHPRTGTAGARRWNFGRYTDADLIYSIDTNTIATFGDISNATNGIHARLAAAETTNATQTARIANGSTNYLFLRPAAAQLPATNFAYPDYTLQQGFLTFPKTNGVGSILTLSALFPDCQVGDDYATNTLYFQFSHFLVATNGPNSSNTLFQVSILRNNTVGGNVSTNDVMVGPFDAGSSTITTTWAQSFSGTNKVVVGSCVISNCTIAAGEPFILKLSRVSGTDTYGGAVGVTSARIYWTRP